MQIDIQASGLVLSDAIRNYVMRRSAFALARLDTRIRRVDVHISDVNGPRGGIDKRCSVQVHLHGATPVVVADEGQELYALLDRSFGRTGRVVRQRVARQTHAQRGPRPQISAVADDSEG